MALRIGKIAVVAVVGGVALAGGAWALSSTENTAPPVFEAGMPTPIATATMSVDAVNDLPPIKITITEYNDPNGPDRIDGDIILAGRYARTYNEPFHNHTNVRGSAEVGIVASEDAVAQASAAGRGGEVSLANDNYEVIVDYASNRRFVIDHVRKVIQEEPLVAQGVKPNAVLADAAARDPEAARRLEQMFNQFNKPRLDPKREFKLAGATGETKTLEINGQTVSCAYHNFNMSGGKFGEVCLTTIGDGSGLQDLQILASSILKYPLPGANRNDMLSRMRQFVEIAGPGRFPIAGKITSSGLENDDYEFALESYNRRDLDPDAFEPPAGYKRRSMFPQ